MIMFVIAIIYCRDRIAQNSEFTALCEMLLGDLLDTMLNAKMPKDEMPKGQNAKC